MMDSNKYENRLVAFLDILGFKELVSSFSEDPQRFNWTLNILKAIEAQKHMIYGYPKDFDLGMEFTVFSDSIVLSSRIPEDPINTSLYQVAFLSGLLLRAGLFVRGAIVQNRLYHKKNIVLGEGLVDAYMQEEKIASFPRIIVNTDIVENYNKEIQEPHLHKRISTWSKSLIRQDKDGAYFIDILNSIPKSTFKEDFIPFLKNTRKIIEKKIERSKMNKSLLLKYNWFRNYFNEILDENPQYKIDKLAHII